MSLHHVASHNVISSIDTGTLAQLMTQLEADAVAAGWTVSTTGDNVTERGALLDAPSTALQIAVIWDSTSPVATVGAPDSGTIPTNQLCIGIAPAGGLVVGNLLASGAQAALWAGYWPFGATNGAAGQLLTFFSEESAWILPEGSSPAYGWGVAGFILKADAPEAGQTSLDSTGRIPVLGGSFLSSAHQGMYTDSSNGRFLCDDQGGGSRPNFRYYHYQSATWRAARLRDLHGIFNPFDCRGNYIMEDLAVMDSLDGTIVGRLRDVHPARISYGASVVPTSTGISIGYGYGPNSTATQGILLKS